MEKMVLWTWISMFQCGNLSEEEQIKEIAKIMAEEETGSEEDYAEFLESAEEEIYWYNWEMEK